MRNPGTNAERYDPNNEGIKKGKGREEGEAQSFGTIDHGGTTGLSDDDHTQYILVTGTRAFSGAIKPATLTNAAAPNSSIYYSSDNAKLVYKDSGGTVNNLY